MRTRGRQLSFRLTALLFGCLGGLLIAEVTLRIVGYSEPEFYRPSSTLGYEMMPGMSGWYAKEGRSWVQINSDGFRDEERSLDKAPDTLRVAVIGDSYVEAFQVGEAERFTQFLQAGLVSCAGSAKQRVQVLSFGVSGYGTAQELLMTREKVWKYQPDVVLLMLTTNNDITDNVKIFKGTAVPYFVRGPDGLVLDNSFQNDPGFLARNSPISRFGMWLKNHLRVVQGIGALTRSLKYGWQAWRRSGAVPNAGTPEQNGTNDVPTGDVGIDNQIYRPPADADWKEAWDVTEQVLKLFQDETKQHNAKFIVGTGSNGIQVVPDVSARMAFAKRLGVDDLLYPDRRIADFCLANSIRSITLVDDLASYADVHKVYLHGFGSDIGNGHWNQTGHRVAGEVLAAKLCTTLNE